MNTNIIKIQIVVLLGLLLASCSKEVDFGEQYQKTLYIVNSRDMLYVGEHFYGTENNKMVFSVYCASSESVKSDVTVQLKIDPRALDSLNQKSALGNPLYVDKVMLPAANYQMPEPVVTIKAGTQYGTLEVPLNPVGLDADITYAFPVSIVENSAGFDVNPELKAMVYEIKMINGFSGEFSGSSSESATTIRSVQPVLKALSSFTVRMPIHTLSSDLEYLDTNFMLLTIASDSTTVTISPWGNAIVEDLGGSTYDTRRQSYELNYKFTDSSNKTLTIKEKITNIEAPRFDEYENY